MSHITVVGLGALGSHVAQALRNLKHGLKLIDFDHVEQKNTLAQFHSNMSLRRNKAQAMQQALQGLWGVKVEAVPHKLTDGNAQALLGGAALVLDCTDNIAARQVMMTFCKAQNIPLLHGAMSADGSFARVIWTDWFKPDAESGDGATCEDGENLPFHMLAGSLLALSAKTFLQKGKKTNYQITPGGVLVI